MPESRRKKDRNGQPARHRLGLRALALGRLFDVNIREASVTSPPAHYHHTSAEALPNILRSRELWGTDRSCRGRNNEPGIRLVDAALRHQRGIQIRRRPHTLGDLVARCEQLTAGRARSLGLPA